MNNAGLAMRNLPKYAKAIEIATNAHQGQEYGDSGKPYIYHLLIVARITKERNPELGDKELDTLLAIAILHDVLEDTPLTHLELAIAMDSIVIADAVYALTKLEGERRGKYLKRCANNPLALEVKICDTLTNLEHSVKARAFKRIEKYTTQLRYLNERERQYNVEKEDVE